MPRPPYRDEGILGPGGRKFIAAVLALAVLSGIAIAALSVDFGGLADQLEEATTTTTEQGTEGQSSKEDASAAAEPAALSTGALAHALTALRDEVRPNPDLLRVLADPDGIELDVEGGGQPVGYRWSDGELTELQFVVVVGPKDSAFPASEVDPGSLGRLLSGAKRHNGGRKLEVVNATLAPDLFEAELRWVLNVQAPNGSNLTYKAKPSGRAVEQVGGSGAPGTGLPPTAQRQIRDAQRRADCFQQAGGDTDAILDCANRLSP
jgi:hypothetical protein